MKRTVDREIFACKNIRLLNFRVVLFLSPRHTGSVGYRRKIIDENFPIYGIYLGCREN